MSGAKWLLGETVDTVVSKATPVVRGEGSIPSGATDVERRTFVIQLGVITVGLCSSVVERRSVNPKDVSSILITSPKHSEVCPLGNNTLLADLLRVESHNTTCNAECLKSPVTRAAV